MALLRCRTRWPAPSANADIRPLGPAMTALSYNVMRGLDPRISGKRKL
jgi:hypothetical protein